MEQVDQAGARGKPWPTVAALLFAGAIAAATCGLPSRRFLSWSALWGAALVRVVAVSISAIIAAWTFSALSQLESRRTIVGAFLNAIWLAPLALLVREHSIWAVAIAAILAVFATQSIGAFGPAPANEESLLFSLRPDNLPLTFKHAPQISTAAALSVQTGLLAAFAGYSFVAAVLVGFGFVAWTWCYSRNMPFPQWLQSPSATESRSLMLVTASFLVVLGALFPYLQSARGYGKFGISPGLHRWVAAPTGNRLGRPVRVTHPDESALSASEGETGIILWPEKPAVTKLVAPTAAGTSQLANSRRSDPLVIPFNGVYWFFKTPDLQPPKTSRQAHASPETVDIRSTDRRPLSIEAHDYLGNLIDLNCCSRIQIAIRNADRYPATVSLELVLVNTSVPSRPSVSLGRTIVKSTSPWNIYTKPAPVSEILNFAIPRRPTLQRFDEVKIVFLLDRARADAGAKIAIDHFVLVPRGL
jgi:hypothetical protein